MVSPFLRPMHNYFRVLYQSNTIL